MKNKPYSAKNNIRIVTAASLFDGHDAAINIMRRVLQSSGAEVIHLGHDRSVDEVVNTAIQEDVQAIAMTSYQGGHNEYFRYMHDLLKERNSEQIQIFGGGGGVILPEEIKSLMDYGINRIYSPDDGREMGLQGMINDLLHKSDFSVVEELTANEISNLNAKNHRLIAKLISRCEADLPLDGLPKSAKTTPVLGITGTGGAGKSSLIDEFVRRWLYDFPDKTLAILSVDPTKRKTGGALLGDRIRMNAINHPNVYMRSMATRRADATLSIHVEPALQVLKSAGFDLIILETSGIGQSGAEVLAHSDLSLYVMTPEYGAASQLEKIDMLDFADFVAVNKFDKAGAKDALKDVKKQYQRNHNRFEENPENMPVFGTRASQFNDAGLSKLYIATIEALNQRFNLELQSSLLEKPFKELNETLIPGSRVRYLSEIAESGQGYNQKAKEQREVAQNLYALQKSIDLVGEEQKLVEEKSKWEKELTEDSKKLMKVIRLGKSNYRDEIFKYTVRNKEISVETTTLSLSGNKIPKVALPRTTAWGDLLYWGLMENLPGYFPFTAGIYPFKRTMEDPTRMFAGEGGPERTNKRFHYLSQEMPAKRLSTAFDSVTLYGQDPGLRPDIYGKIGNAGVSVATLNDAKKLYSGFDLCAPNTSVSMTINGPAPMVLAFFLNAAIDQQCERYIHENGLKKRVQEALHKKYTAKGIPIPDFIGNLPQSNDGLGLMLLGLTGDEVLEPSVYQEIKNQTLKQVRGTVQADILKEDQAQNTCIFSTEFALRLMGDVQEYFIEQGVKNFYSVSISGYHIAEAGANPVTQLAFTLANGFTYVEYYLSRGMQIDDFAPNLSYFFSNGIDPEYAVIGRVARRIWAKAMKTIYGGNERSQKLKYHIQTSGRSLHAQEIDFNDIRTTLQALYAIYDNCNSLHTNAYDEAITTPTEESVRRAMAIQLIINKELGLAKNENPLQGSFIIEELTDLVEEAVYHEFNRLTDRGGVLGAMERMYQRSKIQEESLHYEHLKHSGEYPVIGVNTFLSSTGSPTIVSGEVMRSTKDEKQNQIKELNNFQQVNHEKSEGMLKQLQEKAIQQENLFEELMETVKYCSLGQITQALFEVGGKYRRNM